MTDATIDTTGTAIVATRADPGEDPDPAEIRALADAAGFSVAAAVTQTRPEATGTYLGDGKVAELATLVERHEADAVVFDDELTPGQTDELGERLPDGTAVIDRYRLVLAVFADQAGDRRATLQVELARLQYELPRIERLSDGQHFNELTEKGTWLHHAEDRIDELQRKLAELSDAAAQHRQRRREQGFDLVAIAGYTNAGKSTLLHRLADDLSLDEADPDHPDRSATAAVEDRLFKTLETTTRRATVGGRAVMATDTVGFVDDLPHDLVESFSATIDEVRAADVVVLVTDAADPPGEFARKLATSLGVTADVEGDPESILESGDADEPLADHEVVVALNKADLVEAERLDRLRGIVPDGVTATVATSATEGVGIDALRERVHEALPTQRATVSVPNGDPAMRLVSWAYEKGEVLDVAYGDRVRIEFAGRPGVVEQFRSRAARVADPGGDPEPVGER